MKMSDIEKMTAQPADLFELMNMILTDTTLTGKDGYLVEKRDGTIETNLLSMRGIDLGLSEDVPLDKDGTKSQYIVAKLVFNGIVSALPQQEFLTQEKIEQMSASLSAEKSRNGKERIDALCNTRYREFEDGHEARLRNGTELLSLAFDETGKYVGEVKADGTIVPAKDGESYLEMIQLMHYFASPEILKAPKPDDKISKKVRDNIGFSSEYMAKKQVADSVEIAKGQIITRAKLKNKISQHIDSGDIEELKKDIKEALKPLEVEEIYSNGDEFLQRSLADYFTFVEKKNIIEGELVEIEGRDGLFRKVSGEVTTKYHHVFPAKRINANGEEREGYIQISSEDMEFKNFIYELSENLGNLRAFSDKSPLKLTEIEEDMQKHLVESAKKAPTLTSLAAGVAKGRGFGPIKKKAPAPSAAAAATTETQKTTRELAAEAVSLRKAESASAMASSPVSSASSASSVAQASVAASPAGEAISTSENKDVLELMDAYIESMRVAVKENNIENLKRIIELAKNGTSTYAMEACNDLSKSVDLKRKFSVQRDGDEYAGTETSSLVDYFTPQELKNLGTLKARGWEVVPGKLLQEIKAEAGIRESKVTIQDCVLMRSPEAAAFKRDVDTYEAALSKMAGAGASSKTLAECIVAVEDERNASANAAQGGAPASSVAKPNSQTVEEKKKSAVRTDSV